MTLETLPSEPPYGSYRYYAQQWAQFAGLLDDPNASVSALRRGYRALSVVFAHTAEPDNAVDFGNLHHSFELATEKLAARLDGQPRYHHV